MQTHYSNRGANSVSLRSVPTAEVSELSAKLQRTLQLVQSELDSVPNVAEGACLLVLEDELLDLCAEVRKQCDTKQALPRELFLSVEDRASVVFEEVRDILGFIAV